MCNKFGPFEGYCGRCSVQCCRGMRHVIMTAIPIHIPYSDCVSVMLTEHIRENVEHGCIFIWLNSNSFYRLKWLTVRGWWHVVWRYWIWATHTATHTIRIHYKVCAARTLPVELQFSDLLPSVLHIQWREVGKLQVLDGICYSSWILRYEMDRSKKWRIHQNCCFFFFVVVALNLPR